MGGLCCKEPQPLQPKRQPGQKQRQQKQGQGQGPGQKQHQQKQGQGQGQGQDQQGQRQDQQDQQQGQNQQKQGQEVRGQDHQEQGPIQQQQQQQQQQQDPPAGDKPVLDELQLLKDLELLAGSSTDDNSSPPANGPVPQDVLDLVDQALKALKQAAVPSSGVADAVQRAAQAAQPHADIMAATAAAVKSAVWDMKAGAFVSAEAWQALGQTASTLLSAGSTLSYIEPVFSLLGYAIKQWSTCREECVVVTSKGRVLRFLLAEVHMTDLTSKKELLHKMRLELNTLMTQALADTADALSDKADAVLAACQRLMSLLPRYRPVPLLAGIEGREPLIKELHMQLLPGAGVRGLLLHGMGGAGKTTLASMLTSHLEQSGAFPGGVYKASVQSEVQYMADTNTLLAAQRTLLEQVTGNNEKKCGALDVGAQILAEALKAKMEQGPVLLVVDNVPEGSGGIQGLLPQNLEACMAEGSRVLFTSRNKAAEGLEPQKITNHLVGSLPAKEATRVLRSNSVDLKGQELQQALKFCAGLPLALRLLNGSEQFNAQWPICPPPPGSEQYSEQGPICPPLPKSEQDHAQGAIFTPTLGVDWRSSTCKSTCVSVTAGRDACGCIVSDLPPLEDLRVQRVIRLDDLGKVLSRGTNLRYHFGDVSLFERTRSWLEPDSTPVRGGLDDRPPGMNDTGQRRYVEQAWHSRWAAAAAAAAASGAAAAGSGGGRSTAAPRCDGKESMRQARARLSYKQFSQFLVAIKELNAGRSSREDTLGAARALFGPANGDLYGITTRLLRGLLLHT
ncbi:hypothetical protein OEZ86_010865 [Tetradesmus obliquus]|nr:hypothetical protein OEZ86_010865 [Tetradesmus obliquus]